MSSSRKRTGHNDEYPHKRSRISDSPPPNEDEIRSRAKLRQRQLDNSNNGRSSATPPPSEKRKLDMKAIRASIQARKAQKVAASSASPSASPTPPPPVLSNDTSLSSQRESALGLNTEIHPLLLETMTKSKQQSPDQRQDTPPKVTYNIPTYAKTSLTAQGTKNPYLAHLESSESAKQKKKPEDGYDPLLASLMSQKTERQMRRKQAALSFVPQGKYLHQGERIRQEYEEKQAKLRAEEEARRREEERKQRELAKYGEIGIAPTDGIINERNIRPSRPPIVEWWDEPLLSSVNISSYADFLANIDQDTTTQTVKYPQAITHYIQHPVLLSSPDVTDKQTPTLKLHLTKKETKRLRKNARAERLKEKQDRIRLGLDPAPPPKVKLSNLMSVLTNESISNPTLIEQRVRQEVAERQRIHEQTNQDRKLTREQRQEKREAQTARSINLHGMYMSVFKLNCPLFDRRQRFKVGKNAQQLLLKGIAVSVGLPKKQEDKKEKGSSEDQQQKQQQLEQQSITEQGKAFTLIIVQGSETKVRKYERLLMHRINWKEATPIEQDEDEEEEENEQEKGKEDAKLPKKQQFPQIDLSQNECHQIWTGPVAKSETKAQTAEELLHHKGNNNNNKNHHLFTKWHGINDVASEIDAKDLLSKFGYQNFWVLAHSLS